MATIHMKGFMTREEWVSCEDGWRMLRLVGAVSGPPEDDQRRHLVLAACKCARLALPYAGQGETWSLSTIEIAERWARGEGVNPEDVFSAVRAASALAEATPHDPAAQAAWNAASCSAAAVYCAAAHVSFPAGHAASCARDAARAAGSPDAEKQVLRDCAEIVRRAFPEPAGGSPR